MIELTKPITEFADSLISSEKWSEAASCYTCCTALFSLLGKF